MGVPLLKDVSKNAWREAQTMDLIKLVENENLKSDIPEFNVGDTVKVHVKVVEGKRERIQVFEGIVLKEQHGGVKKHLL